MDGYETFIEKYFSRSLIGSDSYGGQRTSLERTTSRDTLSLRIGPEGLKGGDSVDDHLQIESYSEKILRNSKYNT